LIRIYTQPQKALHWLRRYQNLRPQFLCILGFTDTALIANISAAGATPDARLTTALADGEFLTQGVSPHPTHPLPPLTMGISPVYITRAVVEGCQLPVLLFNAGLRQSPSFPCIDLQGQPARCLTSGQALPLAVVQHLFEQGLQWGQKLALTHRDSYLIIGECVVGGTTTALAVLTALGINAQGKINSSHPLCNHQQKRDLVEQGLAQAPSLSHPLEILAAVGDPMQIVASGMAIAASASLGVLLAGGTQMLAVYALAQALSQNLGLGVNWDNILVGTTRWVAEDPSADTVGLASLLADVPLLATELNFTDSCYPQLQLYERGFVKEGVGAGGSAIAASLYQGWTNQKLLTAIEELVSKS